MKLTHITFTPEQLLRSMLSTTAGETYRSSLVRVDHDVDDEDVVSWFCEHYSMTPSLLISACEINDVGVPFVKHGALLVPEYGIGHEYMSMTCPTSSLDNIKPEELLTQCFEVVPDVSNIIQ